MKTNNRIKEQPNIGVLANSNSLSEEDIKILTFANRPIEPPSKEELNFDKNIFKKLSIYEMV